MNMNLNNQKKEVAFELRFIASQLRMRRIKYKDVAKRLKVDASLISHVLNGTGKSEAILSELRKMTVV